MKPSTINTAISLLFTSAATILLLATSALGLPRDLAPLFSFSPTTGATSLPSAPSQGLSVGLAAQWESGEFIFNPPGSNKYFASAGKTKALRQSKIVRERFSNLESTTISGKLYRLRGFKLPRRVRHADALRHGSFTLTRTTGQDGSHIHGSFFLPDGLQYHVDSSAAGESYQLVRSRGADLPPCGLEQNHEAIAQRIQAAPAPPPPPPPGGPGIRTTPRIRVLFVYSASALASAGTEINLAGYVNVAIAATREAWANSGVDGEVEIAGMLPVGGPDENGHFLTDLADLTGNGDGIWDNVHQLRIDYGADVVSLMVNSSENCGLGWPTPYDPTSMFNVIKYNCELAFRHELGHNLGAFHDRENSSGIPIYPYAYGWRFYGNSATQFTTIMAYAPGQAIDYVSNPNVYYDGQPTGVADWADNVRVFNQTLAVVEAAMGAPLVSPTPFPTVTPTPDPSLNPLQIRISRIRPRRARLIGSYAPGGVGINGVTLDLGVQRRNGTWYLNGQGLTDSNGEVVFVVQRKRRAINYAAFTSLGTSTTVEVPAR